MNQGDPVNQFSLPCVAVTGEPVERVLDVSEFEAWAALRQVKCGHRDDLLTSCRMCLGVLDVAEGFASGSLKIRLVTMR